MGRRSRQREGSGAPRADPPKPTAACEGRCGGLGSTGPGLAPGARAAVRQGPRRGGRPGEAWALPRTGTARAFPASHGSGTGSLAQEGQTRRAAGEPRNPFHGRTAGRGRGATGLGRTEAAGLPLAWTPSAHTCEPARPRPHAGTDPDGPQGSAGPASGGSVPRPPRRWRRHEETDSCQVKRASPR